jgi:hypothetical protein
MEMGVVTSPAEPAVVAFDVEWLLAMASQHSDYSADLQCEVDDLRTLVRIGWRVLSPAQRAKVIASEEVVAAIEGEFVPGDPGTGDEGGEWLVSAAMAHGEGDDPDHDAGDLQGFFRAMWQEMTIEQHRAVIEDDKMVDIAELGGCERFLVKAGDEIEADDWALAEEHFGLDPSFKYGEQQMADYMNAFTLLEAVEPGDAHTRHPMKRSG